MSERVWKRLYELVDGWRGRVARYESADCCCCCEARADVYRECAKQLERLLAEEDVPALVAEVERWWAFARELRKEIERLRYAAEVAKGVSDAHRGNWCDVAFAEGKAEGLLEAVSVVEEMLNKLEAKQHAQ